MKPWQQGPPRGDFRSPPACQGPCPRAIFRKARTGRVKSRSSQGRSRRDFAGVASCALCSLTGFIATDASAQTPPPGATPGVTRKILSQTDSPTAGEVLLHLHLDSLPADESFDRALKAGGLVHGFPPPRWHRRAFRDRRDQGCGPPCAGRARPWLQSPRAYRRLVCRRPFQNRHRGPCA
jgi:hypothetical protein